MWFHRIMWIVRGLVGSAITLRIVYSLIKMQTSDNPEQYKAHIINALKFGAIATALTSLQAILVRYLL